MSVNKIILVGNLGKDPELKKTPSGVSVCTFSLATSENYKDNEGRHHERTEWHNIVAWSKLAEICGQYLHKGMQAYIEGSIQIRAYNDRNGNKRYITEIVASEMQMISSLKKRDQSSELTQEEEDFFKFIPKTDMNPSLDDPPF